VKRRAKAKAFDRRQDRDRVDEWLQRHDARDVDERVDLQGVTEQVRRASRHFAEEQRELDWQDQAF
jgi:hypothetical protein